MSEAWHVLGPHGPFDQQVKLAQVSGFIEVSTREFVKAEINAKAQPISDGSGLIVVHRKNGQFHIARYDTRRKKTYVLTSTKLDESPSIAANGTMVMYATKRGDKGILAAVSIDGNVKFELPSQGRDVREPAWSPHR